MIYSAICKPIVRVELYGNYQESRNHEHPLIRI